jgi:hypothetical protein
MSERPSHTIKVAIEMMDRVYINVIVSTLFGNGRAEASVL